MRTILVAATLLLFLQTATSYSVQPRRRFLQAIPPCLLLGSGSSACHAEVIMVERCDSGEGEGCDKVDPSDPSAELIMQLRKKSKEKNAERAENALGRYNDNNFADYFRASGKVLVRHRDGKSEAIPEVELRKLMNAGTVRFDATGYYFDEPSSAPASAALEILAPEAAVASQAPPAQSAPASAALEILAPEAAMDSAAPPPAASAPAPAPAAA
jgi:hypothetical protein